jgi:dolichol kinase
MDLRSLTINEKMKTESVFNTIFESLIFRKSYHFIGGFLMIMMLFLLNESWIFVLGLSYLLLFWIYGKRISFAVLGILILYFITDSRFTTIGAAIIFVVGDGIAALIGSKYGRTKLLWHKEKTIMGTSAFFVSSFLAILIYLMTTLPEFDAILLVLAFLPSLVGCILEGLPITFIKDRKTDDNLIVIFGSGAALHALVEGLGISTSI